MAQLDIKYEWAVIASLAVACHAQAYIAYSNYAGWTVALWVLVICAILGFLCDIVIHGLPWRRATKKPNVLAGLLGATFVIAATTVITIYPKSLWSILLAPTFAWFGFTPLSLHVPRYLRRAG